MLASSRIRNIMKVTRGSCGRHCTLFQGRRVRTTTTISSFVNPFGLSTMEQQQQCRSLHVPVPLCLRRPLQVPGGPQGRLMLGPGPANLSDRVREALSRPMMGHLHPEFLQVMDETKAGLRYLFQTAAPIVCCVTGTGHAGMEAMVCNLVDEDETLLVVQAGIWGHRAADMAARNGSRVEVLEVSAGECASPQQLEAAVKQHSPAVVLVVHAESSTGVLQPLQGLGQICHRHGALLCVDAVASAGGAPLLMDEWLIDAIYTGSQKVLAAPPGLAPCALSHRARDKLLNRRTRVRSYYMDLLELANYWGCDDQPRRYHHTAAVTLVYALREALALLAQEGLQQCWERHAASAAALHAGLTERGLELFVREAQHRAPTVTTIVVPPGVNWQHVTQYIMRQYEIEVSGGLGPTAGSVWRIGLMGPNSCHSNVALVLQALQEALQAVNTGSKI